MNEDTAPPQAPTLNDAGVMVHELFMSHVRAGFTEEQALDLTKFQLRLSHECPNHPKE